MTVSFRALPLVAAFAGACFAAVPVDAVAQAAAAAPAQAEIPVGDFFRHARFQSAKLSPTGEFLAITQQVGGITSLAVLRADTLAPVGQTSLPDEKSIGAFYWVGPKRIMFNATETVGSRAAPRGTGEWFSVDADGSRPRVLIHYGQQTAAERHKQVSPYEGFSMLDPLPGSGKPLMEKGKFGGNERVIAEIVEIDPVSGNRTSLGRAPRENCDLSLDAKQQLRWASCGDAKDDSGNFGEHMETYYRDDSGKWVLVNRSQTTGKRLQIVGSAPDGRTYAQLDDRKAPAAFGVVDASGKFTELFRDPVSEVSDYIVATDRDTVLGVVTMAGAPKVALIEGETHPDMDVYVSLAQSFPGKFVNFTSATQDGSKILVSVSDDQSPTELYLYDKAAGKARFLLRRADWLDPARMAAIKSFSFKTRDGHTMYGYLTVPPGRDLKNLPMIVNPHGGPIGPRDDWGFNPEAQMFASRGYLVLQLNYRGSGGFGQAFMDMGHGSWGGAMQDDLTDVTRWAVQKGYADPSRICIYGGSYGGYAALMGAAKEPDLYACAIGYVGVYDMIMMNKKGDIRQGTTGREFLEHTLGGDMEARTEFSPVHQASKIKIPVFLAAGMKDARAPYQHTEAMRDALKAAGRPPEVVILQAGEGHGFYKEENNVALYSQMLSFLDRYIGERRGRVDIETMEKAPAQPQPQSTHSEEGDSGGAH